MYLKKEKLQKQPFRGVLNKKYSEYMQQIYRRTSIPKCVFNKVALQFYWNHTSACSSACSSVNLLHIFRTPFLKDTSGWLPLKLFENLCEKFLRRSFLVRCKLSWCFSFFFVFFFYLGFLSRTFTIHGIAGEGGGYQFNSSLPLPPASQALRH